MPTRVQVTQAIALAAGYLERSCGPDGKFVYEITTPFGQRASSYNIVRHAGAMYALAMLNRSASDPKAVDAMVRAATFMRQDYIAPGPHSGQLVVWSEPTAPHSEAELGATGLGLVALTEVRRVAPKSVPLEELQALGRFALFLQREDGSFASKYSPETGPKDWDSLYYPGETALGLIGLYEIDHSRQWLNAAAKALSYLARSRAKLSPVPPDHWALIAMAKLLPYCDKISCPVSREELLEYAIKVCDSIVHDQLRNPVAPMDGAFDATGRTGSVATRTEGLLAALEFLPKDEFRAKVEATAGRGISFLLRAQIKTGPYAGGMPQAFLAGAPGTSEIRIDGVQHALSAWLRYQKSLGKGSRQTVSKQFFLGCPSQPNFLLRAPATVIHWRGPQAACGFQTQFSGENRHYLRSTSQAPKTIATTSTGPSDSPIRIAARGESERTSQDGSGNSLPYPEIRRPIGTRNFTVTNSSKALAIITTLAVFN
ncbi:MAG: hypothetical protein ACLPVW_07950 [Terriglobales bacterium]